MSASPLYIRRSMNCKAGLQMQGYPTFGPVGAPTYKAPNTPKGVWWCMIAFALYLGVLAAQITYGAWSVANFNGLASGSYSYALSGMVFAFNALIMIIELIVLIFFLIGFGYLYGGRNEITPSHMRHLNVSLGFVIAAIVTTIIGSFVILAMEIQSFFYPYGGTDPGVYYAVVGASAVMNTLVAAFVAMAIVLPMQGLIDPKYDMHLYIAAGLGTATPGIVSALEFWQLPSYIDSLSGYYSSSYLSVSTGWPTVVAGVLGLVTFLIFILMYRNVSMRIREGQVKPTRPPVAPPLVWIPIQVMPVMPMYPMYPPYAPAQPVMPQQPAQPPEQGKQESTKQETQGQ